MSARNSEINELKSILSTNKSTLDSVRILKNENSELSKGLKKNQKTLIKFYSEHFHKKFKTENGINFLVENVDMDKEMMRSLSFDLINKINRSVIILYTKESNNLNILCNVSKTLNDYESINASEIIKEICSIINGAGGGQKNYASGSGPFVNNLAKTITNILEKITTN